MFILTEKDDLKSSEEIKNEILTTIDGIAAPDEKELEAELENYYSEQYTIHNKEIGLDATMLIARGFGGRILGRVKKFVCRIINGNSTTAEIIDAVMDAIINIIPGGRLIKFIVGKIVKLILSQGVNRFCPAV